MGRGKNSEKAEGENAVLPVLSSDSLKSLRILIDDFKSEYAKYKTLKEADIETKLVEELFIGVLGWTKKDFEKRAKTRRGEHRGEADYEFFVKGKTCFFLEVKRVGVPLDKEADKQVISYALSKRVPFAISTNFEQLKVFCVEEDSQDRVFRLFKNPDEYLSKANDLAFITKESFEQDLLLKEAGEEGRLKKRISIDKPLLDDLMRIRGLLASSIEKNHAGKYELNEKEEIIQRIIDRLIFIRNCEDRTINPEGFVLEELASLPDDKVYPRLKKFFEEYNTLYNSGLFKQGKDNDCDKITLNGDIIKRLVRNLYESHDGKYIYNFYWIDADVLGQVYEQYLGKILAQTKSGKAKLKDGQAHRKEQGIYYTPTYIVDYIVKNTIGELLKDKKRKPQDLKILDPACGSGSFLIKAFDCLVEEMNKRQDTAQRKLDSQGAYSVKTDILKKNIYGVDLDQKAVEITKLNLLLKAAEKWRKLPEAIDLHIRHGNSLIDDEKIAGLSAFKWTGEFQEGTFDVVIGNPPYVFGGNVGMSTIDKNFFKKHYCAGKRKLNLFSLFIEKAITLLDDGGKMGFIVPNNLLRVTSYEEIRKFMLENTKIIQIINLESGIFEGVTASTIIIILQKEANPALIRKHKVKIFDGLQQKYMEKPQLEFMTEMYIFDLGLDGNTNSLTSSMTKDSIHLGDISKEMIFGVVITNNRNELVSNEKLDARYKPFLEGKDIDRYKLHFAQKYLLYEKSKLHRARTSAVFEVPEKILVQRISGGKRPLKAAYDNKQHYDKESINNILISDSNYDLKYVLALLNSKLLNWYYQSKFTNASTLTVNISKAYLSLLPIKSISLKQQEPLIKLVDRMLSLNKRLVEFGDKRTSERARLEEEIKRTDDEIDDLVYKLYGITEEEKKIIEESLK